MTKNPGIVLLLLPLFFMACKKDKPGVPGEKTKVG